MTDKIEAARAVLAALGVTAEELLPAGEATAPEPDIDALLPRRRWVPEMGEKYWWRDILGASRQDEWDDDSTDRERAALGNVFSTREVAEEHAANIRAWIELRERSDKVAGGWDVMGGDRNTIPGVGFSTLSLRDAAINHIGQQRIDALARWIWGFDHA